MELHKLLRRQLKKLDLDLELLPGCVAPLVESVNDAYYQFDSDREMLERAMELGSDDFRKNQQLKDEQNKELERRVAERTKELQDAKELAEQAYKAKSLFIANISHETRTPLVGILGFTEALLNDQPDAEERKKLLKIILRNGRHLLSLLNDILEASRIDTGKMDVELEGKSLLPIISDIRSLMHAKAQSKDIDFSIEYDFPIPGTIKTDHSRLRQVLLNLIGNAIKFTKDGGVKLVLRTDIKEEALSFHVIDTGIGMSEEEIEVLFEPFTQAGSFIRKEYGGTGLGLYISFQIIDALGGNIKVDSHPGQGSTFTVTIPIYDTSSDNLLWQIPNADMIEEDSQTPIDQKISVTGKVLVAEDVEDNRALFSYLLKQVDVKFDLAENGQIAVDLALEKDYDLVLMDMQMPVLDGYTATAELRKRCFGGKIVAVTANLFEKNIRRCVDAGCDDFLAKPFKQTDFFEMLAKYLPSQNSNSNEDGGENFDDDSLNLESDPEFAEIRNSYLESLNDTKLSLIKAYNSNNLEEVAAIAHQLIGSGFFGFEELSAECVKLELSILEKGEGSNQYDKNFSTVREILEDLTS